MRTLHSVAVGALLFLAGGVTIAQPPKYTNDALEGVFVEKYYTSKDGQKAVEGYPAGATTYRIWIDLRPGCKLQAVFGIANHEMRIESSSVFFNVPDGADTGDNIDETKINQGAMAFDSWITMGAATRLHKAIPKSDDKDGSIIKIPQLEKADGLKFVNIPGTVYYGLLPTPFRINAKDSVFSSTDGSWANLGGAQGADLNENKILIAQITTTGTLHFVLNIQVSDAYEGVVQYVAKSPEGQQILFKDLEQTVK